MLYYTLFSVSNHSQVLLGNVQKDESDLNEAWPFPFCFQCFFSAAALLISHLADTFQSKTIYGTLNKMTVPLEQPEGQE